MSDRRQFLIRQERARTARYDWMVACPADPALVTCVSTPMQPQFCPVCGKPASKVWRPRGERA